MDIDKLIKEELKKSHSVPFDVIMKIAKPIWETIGMTEEEYMLSISKQQVDKTIDDKQAELKKEIAEDAIKFSIGETGEDLQSST